MAEAERLALAGRPLQLAVNVAPEQFLSGTFQRQLQDALEGHPAVDPGLLTIDITESAAVHDIELARRRIEACHELGVRIALDDFATGSSSIALLHELPCDMVKIDQRFIAAMFLRWAALFTATAAQPGKAPFGGLQDLEETCCGVGHWIETNARKEFAGTAELARLERQHELAHQLAEQAMRLRSGGDMAAADAVLAELWRHNEELILAVAQLQR